MTKIIIEEGGQGQAALIMHQERRNAEFALAEQNIYTFL